MVSKQQILIVLLTSLVMTQPIAAVQTNRFRSAYKTIRTDISRLLSNKKMDAEQKKRVMIELAVGMAIVIITGTTMWFWWIRPLQHQPHHGPNRVQEFDVEKNIYRLIKLNKDEDTIVEAIRTCSQIHPQSILLHYASDLSHQEVVIILLDNHNLPINAKNINGETPLHCAASRGQEQIVKLLLTKGADPTIQNNNGETPRKVAEEGSPIQAILQKAEH